MDCARRYYQSHPTIVNNIPKEKNSYDNTLKDFARIDNNLASASLAIGESSNLAQIALTYSYNNISRKMDDYVCILSVLAQVAIDNAKRRFDIDLTGEIKRIKADMNIKRNGLPSFWGVIKKDIDKKRINKRLVCPMNYLAKVKFEKYKSEESTLEMKHFFNKVKKNDQNKKKTIKKIEELITKYSFKIENDKGTKKESEDYLLLRSDFDDLIEDLKKIFISRNNTFFMSWLIDRAFNISNSQKINESDDKKLIASNKSLLVKVLYDINSKEFLKCLSKNAKKQ